MSPSFTSSAAICTLTVPTAVLEKDVVLKLVLHLTSDKQVAVKQMKKGGSESLSLELSSGFVLNQRSAILRAIAGPVLMYALDVPLLGGHGAASKNAGQTKAVLAMSSMQSYMTVAHQIRMKTSDIHMVLSQLESYLEEHMFLIPSSSATLADMEVATALLESSPEADQDTDYSYSPNVMRWLATVHAQMMELGATGLPQIKTPPPPTLLPVFFDGTEAFVAKAESGSSSSSTAAGKKGGAGAAAAAAAKGPSPSKGGAAVAAADASSGGLSEEQKKAAAEKRAKKAALKATKKPAAAAPAAGGAGDTAELNITALDIRVGKIIKAWHHPDAEKLFCEEIDLGEGTPRQIASGLRPFYKTEDLEGRLVLVLCNLKSRNLVGFPSHGMVLCASNADHTKVEFVVPPSDDVPLGERVVFGDLTGDAEPENKVAKKKLAEKLLPDLKTTADGVVVWKDYTCNTTKGPVKALNGMPSAQVS